MRQPFRAPFRVLLLAASRARFEGIVKPRKQILGGNFAVPFWDVFFPSFWSSSSVSLETSWAFRRTLGQPGTQKTLKTLCFCFKFSRMQVFGTLKLLLAFLVYLGLSWADLVPKRVPNMVSKVIQKTLRKQIPKMTPQMTPKKCSS